MYARSYEILLFQSPGKRFFPVVNASIWSITTGFAAKYSKRANFLHYRDEIKTTFIKTPPEIVRLSLLLASGSCLTNSAQLLNKTFSRIMDMREHAMGLTEMIRFFAGLVISTKSLKKQRDLCLTICKEKYGVFPYQKRLTRRLGSNVNVEIWSMFV